MKQIGIGVVMGLIFLTAFALYYTARANPSFFLHSNTTATATTTLSYMTGGTATSTEVFDTGAGAAGSADTATLLVQFVGSSTASTLNIDIEYADAAGVDCVVTPSGCDWYRNNISNQATTTFVQSLNSRQSYTLPFASSTQGNGVVLNTNREPVILTVPTPTRYVRAIFSLAAAGTNGAVWKNFVGKRQAGN